MQRHVPSASALILGFAFAMVSTIAPGELSAQATPESEVEPIIEEPDPTRLDVERLPPEAIDITRDLYSHGFFVEGVIGGRGFAGGVGQYSKIGLYLNIGAGLEIFPWLLVKLGAEGSIHATDAPSPPSPTSFQLVGFMAELRLQLNLSARFGLWAGGEFGIALTPTEVLATYGFLDADTVGFVFGGQLGIDWHFEDQHNSIGLLGGARLHPNLNGANGDTAIGVHTAAYLRHVF